MTDQVADTTSDTSRPSHHHKQQQQRRDTAPASVPPGPARDPRLFALANQAARRLLREQQHQRQQHTRSKTKASIKTHNMPHGSAPPAPPTYSPTHLHQQQTRRGTQDFHTQPSAQDLFLAQEHEDDIRELMAGVVKRAQKSPQLRDLERQNRIAAARLPRLHLARHERPEERHTATAPQDEEGAATAAAAAAAELFKPRRGTTRPRLNPYQDYQARNNGLLPQSLPFPTLAIQEWHRRQTGTKRGSDADLLDDALNNQHEPDMSWQHDGLICIGPELSQITEDNTLLPPKKAPATRAQAAAEAEAVLARMPTKRGFLWKKSPTGFRGAHIWQKRWVVVSSSSITYWKDERDSVPKGSVHLSNIDKVKKWGNKRARFDVTDVHDRVYAWRATSDIEAVAWTLAIQKMLAQHRAAHDRAARDARALLAEERRTAAHARKKFRRSPLAKPMSPLANHDSKRRLHLFQQRSDITEAPKKKLTDRLLEDDSHVTGTPAEDDISVLQHMFFEEVISLHRKEHPTALVRDRVSLETLFLRFPRETLVLRYLLENLIDDSGGRDDLHYNSGIGRTSLSRIKSSPIVSSELLRSNSAVTDVIQEEEETVGGGYKGRRRDGDKAGARHSELEVATVQGGHSRERKVKKAAPGRSPPPPPPKRLIRSNSALAFDIKTTLVQRGRKRMAEQTDKHGKQSAQDSNHKRSRSVSARDREDKGKLSSVAGRTRCATRGCEQFAATRVEVQRVKPAMGDVKLALPYCTRHLDDYHEHLRESDVDEHISKLALMTQGLGSSSRERKVPHALVGRASMSTDTKHAWIGDDLKSEAASSAGAASQNAPKLVLPVVSLRRFVRIHTFTLVHALLDIVSGRNDIARGLAVRVLWIALQFMKRDMKRAEQEGGSDSSEYEDSDSDDGAGDASGMVDPTKNVNNLFLVYIRKHASGVLLSSSILSSLLDILHLPLDMVASRGANASGKALDQSAAACVTESAGRGVHHPSVWPAIFSALRGCEFGIREAGLHDLNTLFVQHRDALRSLQRKRGWQLWLFALLEDVPCVVMDEHIPSERRRQSARRSSFVSWKRRGSTLAHSQRMESALSVVGKGKLDAGLQRKAVFGYSMNLMTLAHFEVLRLNPAPAMGRDLCRTIDLLFAAAGLNRKTQAVVRQLLIALLNKVVTNKGMFHTNMPQADQWKNLFALVHIIIKFVFQTSYLAGREGSGADGEAKRARDLLEQRTKLLESTIKNAADENDYILDSPQIAHVQSTFDYEEEWSFFGVSASHGVHWALDGSVVDGMLLETTLATLKQLKLGDYRAAEWPYLADADRALLERGNLTCEVLSDALVFIHLVRVHVQSNMQQTASLVLAFLQSCKSVAKRKRVLDALAKQNVVERDKFILTLRVPSVDEIDLSFLKQELEWNLSRKAASARYSGGPDSMSPRRVEAIMREAERGGAVAMSDQATKVPLGFKRRLSKRAGGGSSRQHRFAKKGGSRARMLARSASVSTGVSSAAGADMKKRRESGDKGEAQGSAQLAAVVSAPMPGLHTRSSSMPAIDLFAPQSIEKRSKHKSNRKGSFRRFFFRKRKASRAPSDADHRLQDVVEEDKKVEEDPEDVMQRALEEAARIDARTRRKQRLVEFERDRMRHATEARAQARAEAAAAEKTML